MVRASPSCPIHLGQRLTHEAATSNDPWGPTGTDMSDIAALTFNK
jgi:ENTH domain